MSRKPKVDKIDGHDLSTDNGKTVLLWKVNTPLSQSEHEQLSDRARFEEEKSGVRIILVPYSVEVEVVNQVPDSNSGEPDPAPDQSTYSGSKNSGDPDQSSSSSSKDNEDNPDQKSGKEGSEDK